MDMLSKIQPVLLTAMPSLQAAQVGQHRRLHPITCSTHLCHQLILINYFEVRSRPGTDLSDYALFVFNILMQVRDLATLLHRSWFTKTPTVVI